MKVKKNKIFFFALFMFFSCSSEEIFLSHKLLFKIDIGIQEDQINVFKSNENLDLKTGFYFFDNMFFISDVNSKKVMEFTPFGDLISLFYNQEKSHALSVTSVLPNSNSVSSRIAVSYPFVSVGNIAYDGSNLFVEDSLDGFVEEKEDKIFVKKNSVLRIFDKNNKYFGYLGQDGLSGKPFSYIENIYLNNKDIFVISRIPSGFNVYSYNADFQRLYKVSFSQSSIPVPDKKSLAFIESVFPDRKDNNYLYLKVDFYRAKILIKGTDTLENLPSKIYRFNIRTKDFDKNFVIPDKEGIEKGFYNYIGSDDDNDIFLISNFVDKPSNLMVLDKNGAVIFEKEIETNFTSSSFNKFFVSKDGVLMYLIGFQDRFEVHWWRSDKALKRFIF